MTETRDIGADVPGWTPPPRPGAMVLTGRYARLAPLRAEAHAGPLYEMFRGADAVWDYMPVGPFATEADFAGWMRGAVAGDDPVFFAVENLETGRWEGFLSLLRIQPEAGSIEVGWVSFSPALQRSRASTEVQFLLMRWAFEAGYRRYEWKCNALNLASRRAAQRLGLSFEGVFRQALVVKGRNRDTAWFAAIDAEWPALRAAFEQWLAPKNFDAAGRQVVRLGTLTGPVRVASDPLLAG